MRALVTVLALWAAGLGAAAQFGKISVAFGALEAAYPGQAGVGVGLVLSVVGMVGLVFGTTAGVFVARIGARRAMLAALAVGAGLSLLQVMGLPYGLMLASRIVEGASHLAIVIVGPTAIAGLSAGRWQGAAMTLWSSFFGLTYAVLFLIGPELLAWGGLAGLFVPHAVWMAACAVALAVLMPRDAPAAGAVPGRLWAEHRAIYASAYLAAPAMGFVCYTITYVAVLTLLPARMGAAGGLVGVAMPLVSIGLSLTLGVWLLSRMPAVRLVQAGFAGAIAASVALWGLWGGPGAVAAALGLAGALGLVQGASFAALAQLNPKPADRARAAGAIAQLGNLGTTSGTPLLILLLQAGGIAGLVLFVAGFSALGIVIHALQARRRAAH